MGTSIHLRTNNYQRLHEIKKNPLVAAYHETEEKLEKLEKGDIRVTAQIALRDKKFGEDYLRLLDQYYSLKDNPEVSRLLYKKKNLESPQRKIRDILPLYLGLSPFAYFLGQILERRKQNHQNP